MNVPTVDGRWYFHNGIDIALEQGTEVIASTSGRVSIHIYLQFPLCKFSCENNEFNVSNAVHILLFYFVTK